VTAFAALAMMLGATAAAWAQGAALEYAVKAAYLFKFPPFVAWPAGTFAAGDSPINFCVVGAPAFAEQLEKIVGGQKIEEHPIVLRRLALVAPNSGCQVMYVGTGEAQSLLEALTLTRGQPMLTVTDGVRDSRAKGIMNFVLDDNRVRFEIDNAAARAAGLTISSKLLSLAVRVAP
jgi:hypothetical protein